MISTAMCEESHVLPNVALSSVKKVDALLVNELQNLSFKDRISIDEEIHGVYNSAHEETPELLESSLLRLSEELRMIPNKIAFDRSQILFPNDTYVNTLDFRLRFLRCELFDAKKAAIRLVHFLDLVDELYDGDEVLRRPIQLSDLSKDDMKIFRMGFNQLLPYRDRSGRPVFTNVGTMGFSYDLKVRLRSILYLYFVASNDLESQRKGLVLVAWPEGDFSKTPLPLYEDSRRLLSKVFASTPTRIKFHTGTTVERRYTMQGYGIPVEMMPLTDSGNIKRTYLYQWIKVRKLIESEHANFRKNEDLIILLPSSNDVLFRSGTTTMIHPGNAFFRSLIELKHNERRSGSEFTQAILAEDVVKEIERLNGRFLKWDNQGYWTELEERSKVLFKTEVSIRDFKSRVRKRKNRQNSRSVACSFKSEDGCQAKRRKGSNDSFDQGCCREKESTSCAFAF